MALSELKSNLSWRGLNTGLTPTQNVEDTRFIYNTTDLTVTVVPRGFDNAGYQNNTFPTRISANAFNISDQGTASRRSQLGSGTKFPIGPEGQVHQFDIKRTGFHDRRLYQTLYNSKTEQGLAATYTSASPIDDMYNKFKVRDEVYDPFGYARPPFILRGIQRDDSSKPQRWGFGDTTVGMISSLLDIPRGGPLTMGDRILNDAVRLGKMMIRPQGLAFIAKQQLLHLMQPNTEGVSGFPNKNFALNQKLSNPLNTLASALGSPIGLRFRKYGLLPLDEGLTKYEDIHKKRAAASTGASTAIAGTNAAIEQNRLVLLLKERNQEKGATNFIPNTTYWATLSMITGPDSIGGIGTTNFTRWPNSNTFEIGKYTTEHGRRFPVQYDSDTPYAYNTDNLINSLDKREGKSDDQQTVQPPTTAEGLNDPKQKTSLALRIKRNGFTAIPQHEVQQAASNTKRQNDIVSYTTLAYGTIQKLATNRNYSKNIENIVDSTTGETFDVSKTPIGKMLSEYKNKNPQTTVDSSKDLTRIAKPTNNFIEFKIGSSTFYAYITSISISDSSSSDEKRGAMNAYGVYLYGGHTRSISVSFMLAAKNPEELRRNWAKLGDLQQQVGPSIQNGATLAKKTTLRIGNIVNTGVILESLNMDIDQETPWEITEGIQKPYYINVNADFKVVPTGAGSLPILGVS